MTVRFRSPAPPDFGVPAALFFQAATLVPAKCGPNIGSESNEFWSFAMTINRLLAALLALCIASGSASAMAGSTPESRLQQAGELYDRGDFGAAYKQYVKLAKDGSTFAQYRVSYMLLMGQGTSPDVIESLAWAVVAAEHDHPMLDDYQDAVASLVPGDQRKKAESKASYYLRRWGETKGSSGNTLARVSEGICTGSRLAGNCGQGGGGTAAWIAWGPDRSGDPKQKASIERLNQTIVEEALRYGSGSTGR
jgi:hypothetical protein